MSGELIKVPEGSIQLYEDSIFNKLAASSKWLPRMMLGGSGSAPVKQSKVNMGHYYLVSGKDTVIPLSDEVDAIIVTWQPRALDVSGDEIISTVKFDSDTFKAIQDKSEIKDSGAMWGFEFLLWLPEREEFVSFGMLSKTARNEAPNVKTLLGKGATFTSHLIAPKRSKHSWHGPLVKPNSAPFANIPTEEQLREAVEKFQKNVESELEVAEESEDSRAR